MATRIYTTIALLLALSATVTAQSIIVRLGDTSSPVLVAGGLGVITGVEWIASNDGMAFALEGSATLGGYAIRLGGSTCLVRSVTTKHITFIVTDAVTPGTQVLEVAGPAGAFSVNVPVASVNPILLEQGGFVVATIATAFYPRLYLNGEAIPIGATTYNFLSVQLMGVPVAGDATVILDGARHYEVAGRTSGNLPTPMVGLSTVTWFAPTCIDGEYEVRVRVGGVTSPAGRIRFAADCTVPREPGSMQRLRGR